MTLTVYKSKIHRATVTQADLNYIGSITIDEDLMDAANIYEHERVQIVNVNNGERLETYVIPGERGSGVVGVNGAAAKLVREGDLVIVMAYAQLTDPEARERKPAVVFVDASNRIVEVGLQPAAAPAGSGLIDGRLA